MGACAAKNSNPSTTNDYTIDPANFVKVKKYNIRSYYEFLGKIGDGSYGSVYLARHLKSNTKRAVKSIPINGPKAGDLKSLLREVSILKSIDHPNIIKVYEVYQDENTLNIVTEYCKGGELFERIVDLKFLSENQAARYLLELISAVMYLHSKNIVHRDLKPENILFESNDENSHLKIIDFGTCKHFKTNIRIQERIGNPYYMAPEVISSNYNEKCDVWSLGVILYVMLSGSPPFTGKSESELMLSIMTKDPVFEGHVWRNVSNEAIDLIKSMLIKSSNDRPSAQQVHENLWLQSRGNFLIPDKEITAYSLNNLASFTTSSKLYRATLSFIVNQVMSSDEISLLRDTFTAIDKNGDGVISPEELKEAMYNFKGDFALNIDELLKKVDLDGNGHIDYSEFITAAIDWENELSKKRLVKAFNQFDKDGSGKISVEELIEALGGDQSQTNLFVEMVKEADSNGDGEIDLEEFCNFMNKYKSHNQA